MMRLLIILAFVLCAELTAQSLAAAAEPVNALATANPSKTPEPALPAGLLIGVSQLPPEK